MKGLAFSNASLGAVHAMAHSLGGFLDLPHGECNAMLLQHVMEYNFPDATEKYERIGAELCLDMQGMSTKQLQTAIITKIRELRKDVGIEDSLGHRGVHRTEVPELAYNALRDPCIITNPRKVLKRDLEVIYEEAI